MSNHNETQNHSIGYGTYIMVWLGLVALTAITVSVAGLNLGNITIVVALLIAAIKSTMVGNYFMHLKFEHKVFKVFVVVCIVTFIILFILTFSDLSFR
jgi:cytochrome c oxidase subunit 4